MGDRIETMRVVQNFLFCVVSRMTEDDVIGAEEKTRVTKCKLGKERGIVRDGEVSKCFARRVLRVNNSGSHVAILGKLFCFLISIATTCACVILRVSPQP